MFSVQIVSYNLSTARGDGWRGAGSLWAHQIPWSSPVRASLELRPEALPAPTAQAIAIPVTWSHFTTRYDYDWEVEVVISSHTLNKGKASLSDG